MRPLTITVLTGSLLLAGLFRADDASGLPGELGQSKYQTVTATGRATIRGKSRLAARDEAIADALRNAVEQAAGVYVSAESLLENFELVHDKVLTRARGYSLLRQINWERQLPDLDEYHVEIVADVSAVPLAEALKELGLTRQWRVIVMTEADGGSAIAAAAETGLVRQLVRRGFYVVDRDRAREVRAAAILRQVEAGDVRAAAALGGRLGADVVLVAGVATHQTGRTAFRDAGLRAPLVSARAEVDVRAIRVDTAEIVFADRADATGLGPTAETASTKAAAFAIEDLAPSVARELLVLPAAGTCRVQVEMAGFTRLTNAAAFEEAIRRLPGVRAVTRQEYTGGVNYLEVEADAGLRERLATELETNEALSRFGIGVTSDNKNAIVGRVARG